MTVQVTTAEKTVTLRYASGMDGYYLMVEGDGSLYTVDQSTVQALLLTGKRHGNAGIKSLQRAPHQNSRCGACFFVAGCKVSANIGRVIDILTRID